MKNPMQILVADDDPVSRRMLELLLTRWGYAVSVAKDGLEALQILQSPAAPNMALIDWLMPGMDGVDVCREARKLTKNGSYIFCLMLTCQRDKDHLIEGLEAGADDYLTKPFDPPELKLRLRTGQRIIQLMDDLVIAREQLRELAVHDSLTGCWSRAAIFEILIKELDRADRDGEPVGLAVLDLDHFKQINDTHGHLLGDEGLRQAARAMRDSIRSYDALGRYGGEEFLVVIPGCDRETSLGHGERLRMAIERLAIDAPSGPLTLTASVGVSSTSRGVSASAIEMIRAADTALYRAKLGGRNRVEWAAPADIGGLSFTEGHHSSGSEDSREAWGPISRS